MNAEVVEKNISVEVASWIERNMPSSISELRKEALADFNKLGLPAHRSEEFKFTPITRTLEKNIDFTVTNKTGSVTPSDFLIPNVEANVLVFINGTFSAKHSSIISSESDITILPLEDALEKKSSLISEHLARYTDTKADSFAAWNTAAWNTGVFIHVGANKKVETPVCIYHINDATQAQVISVIRNLIIVEKSSAVTVVEKFDSTGSFNHFTNIVTEAFVDDDARLDIYSSQNDGGEQYQYNLKEVKQGNRSNVNAFVFTLNGKLIRNNFHLGLDGEGIESHLFGLYLLDNTTLADNHTVVDHKQPNSFSNELYKGIMDGNSKGVFNGKIYVRPLAQKTNAFQTNRNILLSDGATVNTKPQLEIWADDVKCSHGCTTGQLDEEALFYLQSRGIKKETARAMMLYAFAGELLQNVNHPALRNYFDSIITSRLHKNF
jgi:Fe-S cluster assembly protein SufD